MASEQKILVFASQLFDDLKRVKRKLNRNLVFPDTVIFGDRFGLAVDEENYSKALAVGQKYISEKRIFTVQSVCTTFVVKKEVTENVR